jgi:hypothetical protein
MRKVATYSGFAITSLLEVFAFISANTYIQLGIAVIFYPLVAYFAYKLFVSKKRKAPEAAVQSQPIKAEKTIEIETTEAKREDVVIADIEKRAFLKLIGTAGLSFFIFSLFNRRSEALFFGKAMGPGITALEDSAGNKIDPAERQPTDSYIISEMDENFITFYGFTNKDGAWFIMKEDPDNGTFRYSKGELNFSGNWVDRESLSYDYYHNVFN